MARKTRNLALHGAHGPRGGELRVRMDAGIIKAMDISSNPSLDTASPRRDLRRTARCWTTGVARYLLQARSTHTLLAEVSNRTSACHLHRAWSGNQEKTAAVRARRRPHDAEFADTRPGSRLLRRASASPKTRSRDQGPAAQAQGEEQEPTASMVPAAGRLRPAVPTLPIVITASGCATPRPRCATISGERQQPSTKISAIPAHHQEVDSRLLFTAAMVVDGFR